MRVLLISSSSGSRGGGEFFLSYLGEALAGIGIETGLWASSDAQMDELAAQFESIGPVLRSPYINTYLRRTRSFSHLIPPVNAAPILKQWNDFHPDVLHLNKQCLEDGLDLLGIASRQARPHGCTIHITQTARELKAFLPGFRDWIARRALCNYPGPLWAISRQRARELRNFVGSPEEVAYIPNGVQLPDLETARVAGRELRHRLYGERPPEGPLAVCVGRVEEQKDPFRFLEILGQWKSSCPGLQGVWVGDGRLREAFDSRIREMGAESWIQCVGWCTDPSPYLAMADVYVHPARFEGLPFALLEAMAHQLPCVISPSLADELEDFSKDTWIIAGEDSGQWLPVVMDLEKLKQIGARSRQLIEEKFSIESMARSYVGLYEQILSNPGDSER